jgi:hypothetical protein
LCCRRRRKRRRTAGELEHRVGGRRLHLDKRLVDRHLARAAGDSVGARREAHARDGAQALQLRRAERHHLLAVAVEHLGPAVLVDKRHARHRAVRHVDELQRERAERRRRHRPHKVQVRLHEARALQIEVEQLERRRAVADDERVGDVRVDGASEQIDARRIRPDHPGRHGVARESPSRR